MVSEMEAFRPSVAKGDAIVSRLHSAWLATSPDGLHRLAKGLASALAIPEVLHGKWHNSIYSIIMRPASPSYPQIPEALRFVRNAILVSSCLNQLSTAAAHADGYPPFPVPLLKSLSLDLRHAASDFCDLLDQLPLPPSGAL